MSMVTYQGWVKISQIEMVKRVVSLIFICLFDQVYDIEVQWNMSAFALVVLQCKFNWRIEN